MPAIFGDFLAAASEHLEAAVIVADGQVTQLPEVARELHRLVVVMSHYLDDLTPHDEAEASGRNDLRPWECMAVDTDAALHAAADHPHRSGRNPAIGRAWRPRDGHVTWPPPRPSWRPAGTRCTLTSRPIRRE